MADYPLTAVESPSSGEVWRDPLLISYARSGAVKGRRLQAAAKRVFPIEHKQITEAEKATLDAFYVANRGGTFNFWWADTPGTVYVVTFADESGVAWRRATPLRWDVSLKLAEV